jgi:tRNA(Ile)-lysidine synthase
VSFHNFATDIKALAKSAGVSEETAGRDYRYQCFRQVLKQSGKQPGKIAVAHHLEDRAETMLFNLFRGSGLTGLAGIRPVREDVIRPLLTVSRAEIENYLAKRQIAYRTDHTNAEDIYDRNRIRHHILPRAKEINRQAIAHMAEAADNIWAAESYLRKETDDLVRQLVVFAQGVAYIKLSGLQQQDTYMQKRIIMAVLDRMLPGRKDITSAHISGLIQLTGSNGHKELSLPAGMYAQKEYEHLLIMKRATAREHTGHISMPEDNGSKIYDLIQCNGLTIPNLGIISISIFSLDKSKSKIIPQNKYTKWFDYDKITSSAVLRTRQKGDYLIINSLGNRKTLKSYMINEKIDQSKRQTMYVLADGAHVIWIPGYRISEYYKVTEQTRRIIAFHIKESEEY